MKTKKGFRLMDVCGEAVLVSEGMETIDFDKLVNMNETSAFLWEKASQMDSFGAGDLCKLLTDEYEVGAKEALADTEALIGQWVELGIVED